MKRKSSDRLKFGQAFDRTLFLSENQAPFKIIKFSLWAHCGVVGVGVKWESDISRNDFSETLHDVRHQEREESDMDGFSEKIAESAKKKKI